MVAKRQISDRHYAELAASIVGYTMRVPAPAILDCARGTHAIARARQISMYLTYVGFEMSLARVALAFGRDRSTVAHACRQIEDVRDAGDFDDWLIQLEQGLQLLAPLTVDHAA